MKSFLLSLLALPMLCNNVLADEGFYQALAKSNQLYEEGNFEEARAGYQRLLEQVPSNGHLHYNLGNTWFQSNQYGKAIYHYLRAQKHLPRDEDVEANLSIALRKTADIWDGRRESAASAILFWLNDFTLKEHVQAVITLNLFLWVSAAIRMTGTHEALGKVKQLLTGVLLIALLSAGARWHMESFQEVAVVGEQSLNVYPNGGKTDEIILQLHEGAILPVLDRKGEWIELELPDGKKGWVPLKGVLI